ncbi:MAG TPA: arylamine N-acetyltransferase [Chitinophagaceae bacterium]|nr:arylamine N-acetyltransferase [Chitinophagaceae bacterium]
MDDVKGRNILSLKAYLKRISYVGEWSADLKTLEKIHYLHTTTIPFENISPFVGDHVLLDSTSLNDKILKSGRGGYCFEQNVLFGNVLRQMGFEVRGLAARVRWGVKENRITRRSHMLLLVTIDKTQYIADVGFGGMTMTAPLKLDTSANQSTSHEPYRILQHPNNYRLEAKITGTWCPLYDFDLQEQFMPDYETMNWYMSTYPETPFVNRLMVVRPGEKCRYALNNNKFTIHYLNKESEKHLLNSEEEILDVLQNPFHLRLTEKLTMRLKKVLTKKIAF